ncbi:MAG: TonB family protein [Bacteroidia bacterium]
MKHLILFSAILTFSLSFTYAQADSLNQEPDINAFFFVDEEPQPTNMEEVRQLIGYPPEAVEQDIQGQVVVRMLVGEDGSYIRHKVIMQGDPILATAVEAQVAKLKFKPAISNGKPLKFWVNIPFAFKLIGPEDEYKIAIKKEIKRLDAEITQDPSNYQPYTSRGLQLAGLGEHEKAMSDFQKSISLNPGKNKKKNNLDYPYLFYAFLGQGKTYLAQEKWSDAEKVLNEAVRIAETAKSEDSSFRATIPTAYAERGSSRLQQEMYEAARRDFEKALSGADAENTCAILTLKYELCLKTEDYPCVVSCLDALLDCASESEYNAYVYNRGYYRLKYDDNQKAAEDFETLLERTENPYLRIAAYNQLGLALQKLGRSEESLATIDKAIAINVLHPLPYFFKAKILFDQGNNTEACSTLDKAINFGLEGAELEEAEKLKA